MKKRERGVTLAIAVCLIAIASVAGLRGQQKVAEQPPPYQRISDTEQRKLPITDITTQERIKTKQDPLRKIRDSRHGLKDKSLKGEDAKRFALKEDDPTPVGLAGVSEHATPEKALPARESDAIVVGEVTGEQAFLSGDGVSLYSEFTLRVEEVLKASRSAPLALGRSITTTRDGGGLRFPSGKTILRGTAGKTMPAVGGRYLLFLKYDSEAQYYPIITGYGLRGGKVYPLDGIPKFGGEDHPFAAYSKYRGVEEHGFLNEVWAVIAQPPQQARRYWDGTKWREDEP